MADVEVADFAAIFDALPTPYLVLDPDLRIVATNRAREDATGVPGHEVVGRYLFDAFPDDPDDPDAQGTTLLRQSLERVIATGRPDVMPVQRYNIPDALGGFEQRWWTPVNVPVLDRDGDLQLIVHRVEDVTSYMAGGGGAGAGDGSEQAIYNQGQALRRALTDEAATSRRLEGLVDVAQQLGRTSTVAELTDVVVHRGLGVLGADGGAVAVLDADGRQLELTVTTSPGAGAQERFGVIGVGSELPASSAMSSGAPVLLPDVAASTAWSPEMAGLLAETGLVAWAAYPLVAQGKMLGSLTIGWRQAQTFTERDTDLMAAFAAMCAQTLERIQATERERRAVAAERGLAEALQRSLLTEPARTEHVQVAVRYWPAAEHAEVGGDWYDAYAVPDGTLNLVVGDVAGHDRQAAAAMAQVRNLLRGIGVTLQQPPAAVLTGLDRALDALSVGAVATALLAQVDQSPDQERTGTRTLRWSSAGHYSPVLLRPDGTASLLHTTPDMLLGIIPDTPRHDHEIELSPGSLVVLYTDGLVERRGARVQDGLDWLVATVAGRQAMSAEELCDALLHAFHGTHDDDVAILVLRAD
ncbi:SpoIIE family protein phosphatase [Cellulomonas sp. C5510]|uniref:SpoIIE family protein phosphatase n=1 Tax=Cellulomonas sp. C5510 TaxID=2871170 RepID=UPI001C95E85D|nr:SpoIIE family protein phosphatase [Cellulomonas sp. C5510]QZN84180.1 SpoIIE family protein phosphatase [Cellulomonas sp. C5510]